MTSADGPRAGWRWALLLVFVVLLLEGTLRAAAALHPRVAEVLSPGLARTLPDPRLGHRPNPALPDHDAAGWRNAERPTRLDVAAIGDSQTYGDEVRREAAWPQRLAEHSGRSVYNLALGGYGPVRYAELARDAIALGAHDLVVGLYAGNDYADAYLAVHRLGLAERFRSPDPPTRAALATAEAEREDVTRPWSDTRRAIRGPRKHALRILREPFERHSRLVALVRGLARLGSPPASGAFAGSARKPWDHYAERVADLDPEQVFAASDGTLGTVFTPAARAALVDTDDPRIAEGVRIGIAALREIAAGCADACRLHVARIPTKELVYLPWATAQGPVPQSMRALGDREERIAAEVRSAVTDAGARWIDTLPALRASLARGEAPYPVDWNGHPIEAGNDAIARAVNEALPPR